ncbi:MAG: Ig-like domain-containing protein [Chitinispirillia bacterium]|nr:Ig-like domain-containing protein [Chitinispirillia bacterium]MCL2241299.1 Ig-like domain-containing protein [Chitinispirillia bacterium]
MKKATRHLLLALIAAALCLTAACTINEDNGKPINPGNGNNTGGGSGPTDTLGQLTISAEPRKERIGVGETVVIDIWVGYIRNGAATGGASHTLTATWADDTLSMSRTITTNANGNATMNFTGSAEGLVKFNFELTGLSLGTAASVQVAGEPLRNLVINATPSVLAADGTSKSVITVQVKNDRNNPIVGDTVRFMSTAGLITGASVTDKDGKATADLTSDRRNTTAEIIATLVGGGGYSDSIAVEFRGVSISVTAAPRSTKTGSGDSVIVTAILLDAGNNPIVGEPVTFSRSLEGTMIAEEGKAVRDTNTVTLNTNPRGEVRVTIKRTAAAGEGIERIQVRGAGAIGVTDDIHFGNKNLTITPDDPNYRCKVSASGADTSIFNIFYKDGSGSPISGAVIEVAVTLGSITGPASDDDNNQFFTNPDGRLTTDNSGKATFTMKNPYFSTKGTIWARAEHIIIAKYDFQCDPTQASKIVLEASPFVVGVDGTSAKLIATAYDHNGNRAPGVDIAFNILRGPGGGEHLDPKVVERTGADGSAVTYFIPGKILSEFQGVHIQASHHDYIYSNTVKLTIAGPAEYITMSRNMTSVAAGAAVYHLDITALVSDINQNPIPDGTEVTYSAEVIGYRYYALSARFDKDQTSGERIAIIDTIPVDISTGSEWFFKSYSPYSHAPNYRADYREYKPYPPFNDINKNGIPDRGPHVEPCDNVNPALCADFNGNGTRDTVEIFFDTPQLRAYLASGGSIDALYSQIYSFSTSGSGGTLTPIGTPAWDIDWNWNGVAEPSTAVLIKRTILSENGMADNILTYGQSDAWRVRVKLWAECQGKMSDPMEFILPLSEGAANWKHFD